jgi:hypothetical protein
MQQQKTASVWEQFEAMEPEDCFNSYDMYSSELLDILEILYCGI